MAPLMAYPMRYSVEAANKGVQQALQQKDVALWLSNKINKKIIHNEQCGMFLIRSVLIVLKRNRRPFGVGGLPVGEINSV